MIVPQIMRNIVLMNKVLRRIKFLPPKNNIPVRKLIKMMLSYSAIKIVTNPAPSYSILNPVNRLYTNLKCAKGTLCAIFGTSVNKKAAWSMQLPLLLPEEGPHGRMASFEEEVMFGSIVK